MDPLTPEQTQALLAKAAAQNAPEPTPVETPEQTEVAQPVVKAADVLSAKPGDPFPLTLTDGRKIILQKPSRPMSFHVAKVLGAQSANPMLDFYYKALLWVRQVGELPIPFLATSAMFDGLQEQLGDEGMEEVGAATMAHNESFANKDKDALKKS